MNPVHNHLAAIYPNDVAEAVVQRVETMLERFKNEGGTPVSKRPLTQRDVMLITYADQVHEPNSPPLRTLAEFLETHLVDEISAVHLLPFYPWSSDDGFSVKDFFAVDPKFGDWPDVRRIGEHFDLMFDAVFNHMSAQGDWFHHFLNGDPRFADFFVTVEGAPDLSRVIRPRALPLLTEFQTELGPRKVWTTFSDDQVDLNFKNPDVLVAVLDALLFYVRQSARFIRLDAIAFLWKEIGTTCLHLPQTHRVIQLMRAVLERVSPDVLLITETNVPHADNISYFGDGTNEAQLVYNFALPPLVLHSMQTGNAEKLTRWAQSLVLPSERVTWFNFLASHDGIGVNPARGILSDAEIAAMIERVQAHGGFISFKNMPDGSQIPYEMNINYLDALSIPAANEPHDLAARKTLTAHAIMLSLQGVPGIYFHSLFGSRGDRTGAEVSGIKRRINRQKFLREELDHELGDATALRAKIFTGWKNLLLVRRKHAAFSPASAQEFLEIDPRVFAVRRRTGAGGQVVCIHNISGERVPVKSTDGKIIYSNANGGREELQPFETIWRQT
jgi:glucosylglycerate phosphorylase